MSVGSAACTVFCLHTPDGFGTSKLAARAEKRLGVEATAGNWRMATTVLGMVSGLSTIYAAVRASQPR